MKIFVYWATNPPTLEPQIIDPSEWKNLPKKSMPRNPVGTDIPNDTPGWLHSVSIFGRQFKADHIAIEPNPPGHPAESVKIFAWDDDEEERTPDEVNAKILIIEPAQPAGKGWSAVQRMILYLPDILKVKMEGTKQLPIENQGMVIPVKSYNEFVKPDESITLHGIWESEANNRLMESVDAPSYYQMI